MCASLTHTASAMECTIDIPSVNSTDLNKMMVIALGKAGMLYGHRPTRNQSTVIVIEDESDNDLSPEPRTPHFGHNLPPTFSESNFQFGFSFNRVQSETTEAGRVAQKTSAPKEGSQGTDSFKIPFQAYTELRSEETPSVPDSQSYTSDMPGADSQVVASDVSGVAATKHSVPIPNLSVIPTELPGNTADKQKSFIKFLNEPIAIPANLLDQYKLCEGPATLPPACLDGRTIVVDDVVQTVERGHTCEETDPDRPDVPSPMDVQQTDHATGSLDSLNRLTPQADEQLIPIVTENIASKQTSFIKFLNDPITIPHELLAQCTRLDEAAMGARTTLDGTNVTQTLGHGLVFGDTISAISSSNKDVMQTDPAIATKSISDIEQIDCGSIMSNNIHFQIGEEIAIYVDPPPDEGPPDADTNQSESDSLMMDVAAYQSVDDSSYSSSDVTYTELKPPSPRQEESSSQDSEDAPRALHHSSGTVPDSYTDEIQEVMASCDNVGKDMEEKLMATLQPGAHNLKLNLKRKLNKKIQTKRLQEGKGELKVTFEQRPLCKPTPEEVEKAESRKQKNRDSAVKSREKRQQFMQELEKDVKQLERDNKHLMMEIENLKIEKERDLKRITEYCDCFKSESKSPSDQEQPSTSKSFPQALSEFFSLTENT